MPSVLEALTDPTLPGNGPGRDPDCGNFHLNEWRAFSGGQPCALAGFLVEYDERHEFPRVIDGKIDESMGWSNWPRAGQTNTAIVRPAFKRAAGDDLKIELYSRGRRPIRCLIWAASAFRSQETRASRRGRGTFRRNEAQRSLVQTGGGVRLERSQRKR